MDYDIRIMQTVTNDTLSEVCGFLWGAKGVSWNRVAFGNDSICEIKVVCKQGNCETYIQ